jgi:hypothetical protein
MLRLLAVLVIAVLGTGLCAPPACALAEPPSAGDHGCCAEGLRSAAPDCCGSRLASAPAGLPTRLAWTATTAPDVAPLAPPLLVFARVDAAAALRPAPEGHPPPLPGLRV